MGYDKAGQKMNQHSKSSFGILWRNSAACSVCCAVASTLCSTMLSGAAVTVLVGSGNEEAEVLKQLHESLCFLTTKGLDLMSFSEDLKLHC